MIDDREDSRTFMLYADCVLVRGAARSAIYDLGRNKIVSFSTAFYELILQLNGQTLGEAVEQLKLKREHERMKELVDYLIEHEMGTFVADASRFPKVTLKRDDSIEIHNAIVDVRTVKHDFARIFTELDSVGCEFVQIRAYSNILSLDDLYVIAGHARHKSIRSIEILLPYSATSYPDESMKEFIANSRIVAKLVIHGAPGDRILAISDNPLVGSANDRAVYFIEQRIDSASQCGQITSRTITLPSTQLFVDLLHNNGCLRGKISIDEDGHVKNCPSFPDNFGRFGREPLSDLIERSQFRRMWGVTKDHIKVCRDCEFRYACTDCRAYVQEPGDIYSKPANCAYDPYSGRWIDAKPSASATSEFTASRF